MRSGTAEGAGAGQRVMTPSGEMAIPCPADSPDAGGLPGAAQAGSTECAGTRLPTVPAVQHWSEKYHATRKSGRCGCVIRFPCV